MRLRKKGASPRGKKWQKIIQQKVSFVLLCHPEFFRLYQTNGWAVKLFLIALCQVQFQKVKNNAKRGGKWGYAPRTYSEGLLLVQKVIFVCSIINNSHCKNKGVDTQEDWIGSSKVLPPMIAQSLSGERAKVKEHFFILDL